MRAGTSGPQEEHAAEPKMVAVPFKMPDPQLGKGRTSNPAAGHELGSKPSVVGSTAAPPVAAGGRAGGAAPVAQRGQPLKPEPDSDQTGG